MEVLVGPAIGLALAELRKAVAEQASPITNFKTELRSLKSTLEIVERDFTKIVKLQEELNRPVEEMFTRYLENGKELVRKCSEIKSWNLYGKHVHSKKLIRLDKEIVRYFQIKVPGIYISNMESLLQFRSMAMRDQCASTSTGGGTGLSGCCRVPGLPETIIGFDGHLGELKSRLLNNDTRVLVISAPGGCGKTTLAKMLCHDNQIKGIFGKNIVYVTVSKNSSIVSFARKLFWHYKNKEFEFQSEEEATNQIEHLMHNQMLGSDKMLLLVLDDVWRGSESLVQNLKFKIPGYKILVTSRFLLERFKSTYKLSLLNDEDAKKLLCYYAFPGDEVPGGLVNQMVTFCKRFPLALTVVGASLCGQPEIIWRNTLDKQSFLQSDDIKLHLQTSIDALDELPSAKKCFLDLSLFPEDDRIPDTILIDMWVELYNLDEGLDYLIALYLRNLVNLIPIRKHIGGELEGFDNEHYVTQQDLLRELAIYQSSQEHVVDRERLFIEIHNNDFPNWWTKQMNQPINARALSISTDETFSCNWRDLNAPNVHVLILNIRSNKYTLPHFIETMCQLKVLIVTGYGNHATQLGSFSLLGSLSNLRRIRFEHISVSPSIEVIFSFLNLKKLAFVTCAIGDSLKREIESTTMLPNLTDLEFSCCYDLKELLAEFCNLVHLQNLKITDCHELNSLPKGLGSVSTLQNLILHCCTKLQELPESIGKLQNLGIVDISDCLGIKILPEQFCELSRLRMLNMSGCQGLDKLPMSVSKLSALECVICDEERSFLWKNIGSSLWDNKIKLVKEDTLGSFNKIVQ